MAAHNIGIFEKGNSSSYTESTNSNTPTPFTRAIRNVASFFKLRRIVIAFLLALSSTFPVEDEVHSDLEEILTDRNRNSQKKLDPCESRCLRLKFSHEVASVIFTGECIFPKGTKLELVDAVTGQQVRHEPLASAQVEIFILNDDENWTTEKLNSHIMIQKRGRTSRRDHSPYLKLEGGAVSVNEIKFKHSPKHMKKLKLVKLGARVVVDQTEEIKVMEAVTGPFTIKDKHLKSKKRYPPSPTDDVWRLEHIYKYGAFCERLTENGIKTVEDFLIEYQNNPQRLRHILGKNMSENYWKKATTHAKTCNLDGRKYVYHHLETDKRFKVVFNVADQVIWLDSGCGLHHFNMLSESQKAYAHKLVEIAFANWKNVEKSDNEISLSPSAELGCHLGNLVTVDECQSLEFQNTSGTVESNSAECSTSYAIADRQDESNETSLAIPTWGYLESPNCITSVIPETGDLDKIMQFLCSDAIQFDDSPYIEHVQANDSAAATQFDGLQHGERMDHQCIIIEDGTNANEQRQMNNVLMVREGSTCNGKYKKSWTMICIILKWLALKRFVKLKKVRMTKKRKLISRENTNRWVCPI